MTAVEITAAGSGRRIADLARRVALWSALVLLLAATAVFVVVPNLVGGAALTVRTGSMAPTLPVGSIVIVRQEDASALHVGDIATYATSDGKSLVTHRIVAVNAAHSAFTFRGDANPVADPEQVPASAIRGRVWFDVPYAGTVRNGLGDSRGTLVVGGVVCLGLYSLWQFATAWRERKGRT